MITDDLIREMKTSLAGVTDSREANALVRIIVEEVLHYSPVDVLLRGHVEQDDELVSRARGIVSRLCAGEPIQYVFGHAPFHGLNFKVTPATLIPRPETERLVDIIADEAGNRADLRVLDIGTGSGCIAIALSRALKFAQVTAFDISPEALHVARENAQALHAKVNFVECDILATTPQREAFDIIVSNPPYVCLSERAQMERHVLEHEPATALFVPDSDPLRFYRAITQYAETALSAGGKLYFEINRKFGAEIALLTERHGFDGAQVMRDQFGAPRFVAATKK